MLQQLNAERARRAEVTAAEGAKRAIMADGNYGEIFAKHIGESTPIGLARGLNAQWTEGGLLYSPPFR